MSAFLASSESDLNGSMVVWVACIADPSGKFTTLLESPVMGKFSSGQTKLEVAPESTTMVDDAFHWKGLCLLMHWFIHTIIVDRRSRCTSALLLLLMVASALALLRCTHHHYLCLLAGPSDLQCSCKCSLVLLYLLLVAHLTLLKAPCTLRCS